MHRKHAGKGRTFWETRLGLLSSSMPVLCLPDRYHLSPHSPHRPPLKVKFSGVNEYIDHGHYDLHGRHGDSGHTNDSERHGEQNAGRKGQSPSHAPSGHGGHGIPGHGGLGHKEQSSAVDRGRHGEVGHYPDAVHGKQDGPHWKEK